MKALSAVLGSIIIMLSGMFIWVGWEDMVTAFHDPADIYEDYPEEYKRFMAVDTELYLVLDQFAGIQTQTRKNGAVVSSHNDYYYIIPVFTENETYYIAAEVDPDERSDYNAVSDLTWDYLTGKADSLGSKTIEFTGGIGKLDKKVYGCMTEWFEEHEYFDDDADIEKYVLPLVLNPFSLQRQKEVAYQMTGLFLLGVLMVCFGLSKGKKKKTVSQPEEPVNSMINIAGVKYPASNFESVNRAVYNGEKIKAIKELREITGIGLAEAKDIVERWNEYWQ